jgi:DNA-binding response OmpR family regulator
MSTRMVLAITLPLSMLVNLSRMNFETRRFQMAKTILIVDDSNDTVYMLNLYLTEQGFHVMSARNGHEALAIIEYQTPDLILLDLLMPEMDGFEFMRSLRKDRKMPIIILSAKNSEEDKVMALKSGADDYVTKPFSVRELIARIRAALRRTDQKILSASLRPMQNDL